MPGSSRNCGATTPFLFGTCHSLLQPDGCWTQSRLGGSKPVPRKQQNLVTTCAAGVGSVPWLARVSWCSLCSGQASSITTASSTHSSPCLLVSPPCPRGGMLRPTCWHQQGAGSPGLGLPHCLVGWDKSEQSFLGTRTSGFTSHTFAPLQRAGVRLGASRLKHSELFTCPVCVTVLS